MICVLAYRSGQDRVEVDRHDEISEIVGRGGSLVWVDMLDPSAADLEMVQKEFGLHPLAIEDAHKHRQRPKLEEYPTHAFVVAYSSELAEVDLFVGPDWLVSVRETNEDGHSWSADAARARFERTKPEQATVGFLLYVLLDELVDGYFARADELEDRLEELEDRIFADDWDSESSVQQQMFTIRRELLEFRRRVVPLREVVNSLLRGEVEWVDRPTRVHLQDVYDHVLRSIDVIDSHRELLGNAAEAHLAVVSNNLSLVMKKLTSWGALLLGATLVAGIYGMNFEYMPELDWRLGYPFALGLMLLITVLGYRQFKRRGWL
ncbi:MAG TPA: magnesium/cobalt transporter CorA [Acidimicrobiales bacterium]|nr:magnesium/cobalt transporter CorA [Acidimicrobiales bacterium]